MKDKVPSFASEEEEASCWFENRGELEEEFLSDARTGRLRTGSTALRRATEAANALTIHLSDPDLAVIRRLAAERGQDEDTCAAAILHRALETQTPGQGAERH